MCEGRFSYDAFVLNNKKDAIYYSGPFAATERAVTLNVGEVFVVNGVNATGTITATSGDSSKVTASVSGNAITLTGVAKTTAGSDVTITLTDGNSDTTTITVAVV